jgi:hypothetical protein
MTFRRLKQRLRERSEYVLRLAAMEDVGGRHPGRISKSALPREGAFWRYVFVPLYRRVPWSFKRKAMRALKMTAQNWPEDARRFGQPWRPPVRADQAMSEAALERPLEISGQTQRRSERAQEIPSAEH